MAHNKHSNHDYNQSKSQYPSEYKYPFLTQFGITAYLLNHTNRDSIRSILRDIEQLNYDHNLSFMRMNSTADFFKIPNFISSKKSYDNLKRKGRFVKEILECMSAVSNTSHTEYTNKPLASKLVTQIILTHLLGLFARVIDQNGISLMKIMDYIETSSVISDVGVSERNMLSVLQRHLKVQLNGKNIFSKNKDIDKLTERMPLITTTDPMFEI